MLFTKIILNMTRYLGIKIVYILFLPLKAILSVINIIFINYMINNLMKIA